METLTLQEKLAYWRTNGAPGQILKDGIRREAVIDCRPELEGRTAGFHDMHYKNGKMVRQDATVTPPTVHFKGGGEVAYSG